MYIFGTSWSTIGLSPCKKKGKGAPKIFFGGIFRKIRPNYSIHAKINLFKRNLNFAPPHHFQHSATPRFAMYSLYWAAISASHIMNWIVAQLVSATGWHSVRRGFKSHCDHNISHTVNRCFRRCLHDKVFPIPLVVVNTLYRTPPPW